MSLAPCNANAYRRDQRIAALVRPASQANPAVETLRSKGIAIRVADVVQDSVETLEECLAGVDILLSVVSFMVIEQQKQVMTAAKKAGVGRVIPCDFGTACPPGRRALHDKVS
jgi:putative NADH-flavin reductase